MYIYKVRVIDVIDGDTVKVDLDLGFDMWLNGQNIRLFGLDAPESRTTDMVEKKFGLLTKAEVEKYMPVGSIQQMSSIMSERGKFGRILGEFLVKDPDSHERFNLNRHLIDSKLAVPYDGTTNRDTLHEAHHENRMYLIKEGFAI
jgi:micrococcal nuclease